MKINWHYFWRKAFVGACMRPEFRMESGGYIDCGYCLDRHYLYEEKLQ